ncbi:MAG: thiazole synthase [Succinivibrionaceae bacterium]|nr:thiazole synthase [Succinivibrionaceae bacterium]
MADSKDELRIGGYVFTSRLFTGTGKFPSSKVMAEAVAASGSELVTVAVKRVRLSMDDDIIAPLLKLGVRLLPNTAGSRTAKEAVYVAGLAREALETDLIKLEVHPDPRYLLPDPVETLLAAEILIKAGYTVMPYCQADPVLCKRLEEAGCACVMPLAAPIGTNRGLVTRDMLEIIVDQANVPVIVDAGIGAPSHAAAAMEMGADAVLVNTAIAVAGDPVAMAGAFRDAVDAGRRARLAGLGRSCLQAVATSNVESFLSRLED